MTDDPMLTSNTHTLGGVGQWEDRNWKNKTIITDLIRSQNTNGLSPSRSIDITFSIDKSNNSITFNSVEINDLHRYEKSHPEKTKAIILAVII